MAARIRGLGRQLEALTLMGWGHLVFILFVLSAMPAWAHEYAWVDWTGKRHPTMCQDFFSNPPDYPFPLKTAIYDIKSDHIRCSFLDAEEEDDSVVSSLDLYRRAVRCDDGYIEKITWRGVNYNMTYISTCVPDPKNPPDPSKPSSSSNPLDQDDSFTCPKDTPGIFRSGSGPVIFTDRGYFVSTPPLSETLCYNNCSYKRDSNSHSCYYERGSMTHGFCNFTASSTGEDCFSGDAPLGQVGDSIIAPQKSDAPTPVAPSKPPITPDKPAALDPIDSAFSDRNCFDGTTFLGADCMKGARPTDADALDDKQNSDLNRPSDLANLDKDKKAPGKSGIAGFGVDGSGNSSALGGKDDDTSTKDDKKGGANRQGQGDEDEDEDEEGDDSRKSAGDGDGENLGEKIDKTNSLLEGIGKALDNLIGQFEGFIDDVFGDPYEGNGEEGDADIADGASGLGDKLAESFTLGMNNMLQEQEDADRALLDDIPSIVSNEWFGSGTAAYSAIYLIDELLPRSTSCSPFNVQVNAGKLSTNLRLDACELSRIKPLLEWIVWMMTLIGVWRIAYFGLRLESARAEKGGF